MPDYVELAMTLLIGSAAGFIAFLAVRRFEAHKILSLKSSQTIARRIDVVFYCILAAFLLIYAILDLGKFEAFNIYGLDFALFDQAIWNSLHGRLFQETLVMDTPLILGQHFSVILLALVPLYAVYPNPRILVLLPVVAVALTTLLLYWFARPRVGRGLAFVISAIFVLSPGIQLIALGQFYEIMLAMPLLMLVTIFLLRRTYVPFFLTLGVLFLCKEDIPLIAVGFGLYLFFAQRKYLWGTALIVGSLGWFAALVQYILPFFQGTTEFYYFFGGHDFGTGMYTYLGTGLPAILRTLFTRLDIVFEHVLIAGKIDSALKLIIPLGLIPFLGAEVSALALPTLGYTMLSDRETQYILGSHHYSAVVPFLMLGEVVGVHRLVGWLRFLARPWAVQLAIGSFLIVTSMSNYYLYAPGPLSRNFSPSVYSATDRTALGHSLIGMIPSKVTVVSQMEFLPHVAERSHVYEFGGISCLAIADYLFADLKRPWYQYHQLGWDRALRASYFETVAEQDGYVLKKYKPLTQLEHPMQVDFGNGINLLGYSLPQTQTVYGGQTLEVVLGWKIGQAAPQNYAIELSVLDAQGHVWAKQERLPCRSLSALERRMGPILTEDFPISLPPTMPSGDYEIAVSLFDKDRAEYLEPITRSDPNSSTESVYTPLKIGKNKSSIAATQLMIEQRLYVDMQEMRLLGYIPPRQSLRPGELLQVGLYWRARAKPQGDYLAALQLRDANGKVTFEHASRPAQGTYPTTQWDAGEVLLDWHDFNIPQDIPAGEFQIIAVLREQSGRIIGEADIANITVTPWPSP